MKIAGYTLQVPNSASLLLFISIILVVIFITLWARHSPAFARFFKDAHTNNTGRPGLKYIIASFMALLIAFIVVRGCLYNVWPPEYFTIAFFSFEGLLLGLGSWDLANAYKSGIVRTKPTEKEVLINDRG